MKNRSPIPKLPSLLKMDEKHETLYYLVSTEQDLFDISLRILQERYRSGRWYYDPSEYEPETTLTLPHVGSLPDGSEAQQSLMRMRSDQIRLHKKWEEEMRGYKEILDTLEAGGRTTGLENP